MNWRRYRVIILLVLILTNMFPYPAWGDTSGAANISRLSGSDRVETALAVCAAGWSRSDTVVLAAANQENMADTLAALSLAGQEKAPILLTDKNQLDDRVAGRVEQLGVQKVYAIGALSDSVAASLKDEVQKSGQNIDVEVIKGDNRQETAAKVKSMLTNPGGQFIVGGNGLVDALSAGSYAYANSFAFTFSGSGVVSQIQNYPVAGSYILGGTTAVQDIPGITRISGTDRYETNRAVIGTFNMPGRTIYIANGADGHLADALVGAALAGKTGSPVYLTDGSGEDLTDLLKDKIASGSSLVVLGGTAGISEAAKLAIAGAGGQGTGETSFFAVSGLKSLNLLQLAVEFSRPVNAETAENVGNYIINGKSLTDTAATAELQADERTVIITLNTPLEQFGSVRVEVKDNRVYAADRRASAPGYEGEVTAADTEFPGVQSVTMEGNRKLTVKFSEAVGLSTDLSDYQQWRLDGQGLTTRGLQAVKVVKGVAVAGRIYGAKLEMYFSVSLSQGTHDLEVIFPDNAQAAGSFLRDGEGYRLPDRSISFAVAGVSGSPAVQVQKTEGNAVYLQFDRPMYSNPQSSKDESDPASALNVQNYTVNGAPGDVIAAEFVKGSGQSVVKLLVSAQHEAVGANIISLNKKIADLFGECLTPAGEDLRLNFTVVDDKTAPQVEKVEAVTGNIIRVAFSKDVNGLYALNKANYLLKDADGAAISIEQITAVPAANMTVLQGAYPCTDLYEIHTGQRLDSSGYTLKVANIMDMAFKPNMISEVTITLNGQGGDATSVKALETIGEQGSHTLVVRFSGMMNQGSILDVGNYLYVDGENPAIYRSLPAGTEIVAGPENRSAVITLPEAYLVDTAGAGISGHDARYQVKALQILRVKDEQGHVLAGGASLLDVIPAAASAYGPLYIPDSFTVSEDGDNAVQVEFKLDQVLNKFNFQDFQVGTAGNRIAADSGKLSGRSVILTFTDPAKVAAIRSLGKDLLLYMPANPQSSDIAGVKPAAFPAGGYPVYDDQVRPRVLSWSLAESGGQAYVLVTFSEAVDGTVTGLYADDFSFYAGGTAVDVRGVRLYTDAQGNVVPNVLEYDLAGGNYTREGMLVRMNEQNISIRDLADAKGDHNTCVYRQNM
jgi:putative cell wall-binding protein